MIMQVTTERSDQAALTIDKSAALLGLHEFSLLSRIQAGEIKSTRLRSGEMAIPESELERLARSPVSTLAIPSHAQETDLPDDRLGIERTFGGLRRDGERIAYSVAGGAARLTETEIKGYRAAFGAIASEVESATEVRKHVNVEAIVPDNVVQPAEHRVEQNDGMLIHSASSSQALTA
jgi:hypothetical protein